MSVSLVCLSDKEVAALSDKEVAALNEEFNKQAPLIKIIPRDVFLNCFRNLSICELIAIRFTCKYLSKMIDVKMFGKYFLECNIQEREKQIRSSSDDQLNTHLIFHNQVVFTSRNLLAEKLKMEIDALKRMMADRSALGLDFCQEAEFFEYPALLQWGEAQGAWRVTSKKAALLADVEVLTKLHAKGHNLSLILNEINVYNLAILAEWITKRGDPVLQDLYDRSLSVERAKFVIERLNQIAKIVQR